MITSIIYWSIRNRFLVLLASLLITGLGLYSLSKTPVDALPDLSDVQVIIKTSFPGQAPQVVEDQVTYPLTTAMLSVPGAETVRGYSFFGDSYVYVIFDEDTDMCWVPLATGTPELWNAPSTYRYLRRKSRKRKSPQKTNSHARFPHREPRAWRSSMDR